MGYSELWTPHVGSPHVFGIRDVLVRKEVVLTFCIISPGKWEFFFSVQVNGDNTL